jgi:DNA-directed RNA polymerase sigma subunit (sigma70/sigma32)
MGVTRERIRQIEAKAIIRLQQRKRSDQLRDFADGSYGNSRYDPDG